MTKQAIIYARVSTDEQAEHGYSLPTQLEACRKYAEARGFSIVAELQDDCSGAIRMSERPQGAKLLVMLDRKEGEAVIVYTSDRLSRNLAHSLILREDWQRTSVELHYADRGKTENTAEGRLMQNVESVIAEYEREKIRERTKRGKLAKAKAGKWVGAGPTPYGYRHEGQGQNARLVIDEAEASIVRRIFAMYVGRQGYQAMPILRIAKELTAEKITSPLRGAASSRGWHFETVRNILTRRTYIGEVGYNGHTINIPEAAMIDNETFEAAQKQIGRNKERAKRNRKHDYLLTSFFRCVCGAVMTGITRAKGNRFYRCRQMGKNTHLATCDEIAVRVDEADQKVWEWVEKILSADDDTLDKGITEMMQRRGEEIEPKRKELEQVCSLLDKAERKIKRLATIIGDTDDDTALDALKAELKTAVKQKDALTAVRTQLEAEIAQSEITEIDRQAIKTLADQIRRKLGHAPTCEQKRGLFELINLRVRLLRDGGKRSLHVTCGLKPDGEQVSIETPTSSCPSKSPLKVNRPDRIYDQPPIESFAYVN